MSQYKRMQDLLKQEEVVSRFHDQIRTLLTGAREYWSYYCQYDALNGAQKTLQQYYESGVEKNNKASILERLYIDFYWRTFSKIFPDKTEKDFWTDIGLGVDRIENTLILSSIKDASRTASFIFRSYEMNYMKASRIPAAGQLFRLDTFVSALGALKDNRETVWKGYEESFENVYAPSAIQTLLEYANYDDKINGQVNFIFRAGDIRGTLYNSEITNRTPNKLISDPGKEIYYARNFRENLLILKTKIKDILQKYPESIVDTFVEDLLTIKELDEVNFPYNDALLRLTA